MTAGREREREGDMWWCWSFWWCGVQRLANAGRRRAKGYVTEREGEIGEVIIFVFRFSFCHAVNYFWFIIIIIC